MKHLYGIPYTFCAQNIKFEQCQVVILPVPYEGTVSYLPGTKFGPRAIIEASRENEGYDYQLEITPEKIGIYTLDELEPNKDSPFKTIKRVQDVITKIIDKDKFPVMIGGEHSITLGAVRAINSKFKKMTVLYFDAHADVRDELEGTKYSHSTVMRRVSESCPIVGVGIREMCQEEHDYIKKNKLVMFDVTAKPKDILKKLSKNVYISIDLDVLDPSIMPSVGTPVPNGMDYQSLLNIIKLVCKNKNVVGLDVCELRPIPALNGPDTIASKIITKTIGYIYGDEINGKR